MSKKKAGDFDVLTGQYCNHFSRLPDGKGCCDIYDDATGRASHVSPDGARCMEASLAARAGLLPPDCPYARQIPGYRSKVINYY
jgi:hypothetical protein